MSNLMLPGSAGDGSGKAAASGSHDGAQGADAGNGHREGSILDAETCLRGLGQLPGLVALGVLKPAQANAIRGSYREILQYHQRSQVRDDRNGLSNVDVLELMRTNPRILSMLEPLLTQEQIAMVMRGGKGDAGGQA